MRRDSGAECKGEEDRGRRTAGLTGGMLAAAVTLLLLQQAVAEPMKCAGDGRKSKQTGDSRCDPRPAPELRVEPFDDEVGESRVPPRSPDLGAAFNPLSPSIGPGSGKLGPEAGRGALQPDKGPGRGDLTPKKRKPH